ncbi:MAG: electron transport complex subunit RsxA [Spirochaetes bacterium GWF1_51_8]|nr:MAG: electron transport complex subunit RsxA [Spirochaetes bacterium GWF1_51_8]
MNELFVIIISAIFVNNFILSQFLGLCPFFGVSKRMDSAIGMGFAVTFVLVMSIMIIYPINQYILIPLGLDKFLQISVFILVIAAFVQLVEIVLKKLSKGLYKALGIYLPLITTNCAILGSAFLVLQKNFDFLESIVFGFAAGIGFTLALVMMSGVRERLENADVPAAFKDLPIAFITATIMSLAMFGFMGIVKLG